MNLVKLNHVSSKVISKITAGLTVINFIYSTRDDLISEFGNTPKKLDEINVFYDSKCIKKFKFDYTTLQSIINNNVQNPTDLKRLQLNKLSETSCNSDIIKPYLFEYNPTLLPSKLSFAQDKWGYYNGKNNNFSFCPKNKFYQSDSFYGDRSVDSLFVKAGSLNKITYPTKGSVNFYFEKHLSDVPTDYYIDYGNPSNTAVSNLNPTTPNGNNTFNSTTFTYHEIDQNDILVLKTTLMFPSPLNGAYSYGTYAPPSCTPLSGGTAVEIIDLTINKTIASISYSELNLTPSLVMYGQSYYSSKSVVIKRPINPDLLIDGHSYKINTYGSGNCFYNMAQWNICKYLPIYDVGGLRINKITHKNYDDTLIYEKSFRYYFPKIISNLKNAQKVSWDFSSNYPTNYQSNYYKVAPLNSNILYNKLIENLNYFNNQYMNGYYYSLSSGTDPFEINFLGPIITYGEVIETDNNGITKNIFYKYKNYFELNFFDSNYKMPPAPKFQSILAGTKQSESEINTNGITVKNNFNDYNYSIYNTNVIGLISYFYDDGLVFFDTYSIQGQIKTLKIETETTKLNGQDITITKEYEYNAVNNNSPSKITTKDSKGNEIITKMSYPSDPALLPEPFMQNLVTQNRISTPIKVETFKNTEKLTEQKTTYANDISTGNLLQEKNIYSAKFPNNLPVLPSPINSQLELKVTLDLYDTQGNLLQYKKENDIPISIIWGYNKTQPIAKIENATNSQIASALGVSDLNSVTESSLSAINNLRSNANLTNSMITTYTYIPLVGVSTITDPKGDTITYFYDSFGRLQSVKDKDGNILSENQYNYKPN
jgi:YD repeat-containing protein